MDKREQKSHELLSTRGSCQGKGKGAGKSAGGQLVCTPCACSQRLVLEDPSPRLATGVCPGVLWLIGLCLGSATNPRRVGDLDVNSLVPS